MSIHFESSVHFAMRVWIGGINAISGAGRLATQEDNYVRTRALQHQDYIVTPDQKWLDGGFFRPDRVRQFVAMPVGERFVGLVPFEPFLLTTVLKLFSRSADKRLR